MNYRSMLLLFALFALPTAAPAKSFSQLVEFSGALSDTGNYVSVPGNAMPPFSQPPFHENRTTNGPVAGEVLASRLGLTVKASMHLVGPAVGTNFAVRDALAGGNGPHDLPAQLSAYLAAHGNKANPDALYFLFIGGNDVISAVTTPNDRAAGAILHKAVKGIEKAIRTLVAAGARTILVPDFVDISLVPALRNNAKAVARARRISTQYNKAFYAMLDRVEAELRFDLIRWSFDNFLKDVDKHGEELGFTNTKDSCLALMQSGQCDFDHFLYLNETFPSAKFHELMGSALALATLQRDSIAEAASPYARTRTRKPPR